LSVKLDDWQKQVLETEGNVCLRSGRQVGKSFVVALKTAIFAIENPNKTVLVISSVERQAYLLFEKILDLTLTLDKNAVKKGKDKPTKHKLTLKNKSRIYCLPTGLTGYGIRGYTVDLLIADEAAFIPEDVWVAVTPMLAVTKGNLILLSTPFGKGGYFYDCFNDPNFSKFHVSSEDCERISKEFLDHEKTRLTRLQYAQEYLGEFLDELKQLFKKDLINSCRDFKWDFYKNYSGKYKYFLGVDIARYGGDENSFVIVEVADRDHFRVVHVETSEKVSTTKTIERICYLTRKYDCNKVLIDDGGIGGAVFDVLIETPHMRTKIVGVNNARRAIDRDGRRKTILKENLYMNLLQLMEAGKVKMIDDLNLFRSLESVQIEYVEDQHGRRSVRIFGKYTHIAEGLIRAMWGAKGKNLNIFVHSF